MNLQIGGICFDILSWFLDSKCKFLSWSLNVRSSQYNAKRLVIVKCSQWIELPLDSRVPIPKTKIVDLET